MTLMRRADSADELHAYARLAVGGSQDALLGWMRGVYATAVPRAAQQVYDDLLAEAERAAPLGHAGAATRRDDAVLRGVWERLIEAFLREHGGTLIRHMTTTLLAKVQAILTEGVTEGLSISEIAGRFEEAIPGLSRGRARVWARTETLRATAYGSRQGALQAASAGLELEKEWRTSLDGRERATHAAAHTQRRGLDEPYEIGGHACQYPRDPALPAGESVQCRCTEIYHVKKRAA